MSDPLEFHGYIKKIGIAKTISGDVVKVVTLEIHGNVGDLVAFMDKPLRVSIEEETKCHTI